jgi:pyruvate ferredoxin oxidoreductase delta subunit
MGGEKLGWKDLELGCVVTEPGSAGEYSIKCGICYIYCPEACIKEDEEGYFEADLYYCKGCGICAHECPRGVITMVEEVEE